jgi:hypothetical protein
MARSIRFRAPKRRPGPSFPEALRRMREGALLRLTYVKGAPGWEIDGEPVAPETVALLSSSNEIVADSDALFDIGVMPQTWRART